MTMQTLLPTSLNEMRVAGALVPVEPAASQPTPTPRATLAFAMIIALALAAPLAAQRSEEDTTFPLRREDLQSSFTVRSTRDDFRRYLEAKVATMTTAPLDATLTATLDAVTAEEWSGALWVTGLIRIPTPETSGILARLHGAWPRLPADLQRQVLEVTYGTFPRGFEPQMTAVARETSVPKLFAMASLYLLRANSADPGYWRQYLAPLMEQHFPDWRSNPILTMLEYSATDGKMSGRPFPVRPPLVPLLARSFAPGSPVVYTFQRRDRDYEGLAVVRRADGRFARWPDGTPWHIGHLARSNSDLPGFITNGNTPQGVFTVVGLGVSKGSKFIGKTPWLESVLPVEAPPDVWFHDASRAGTSWTEEMYLGFLPAQWRGYFPVREAWLAGRAGRSEMLSHGTCIDPEYYTGDPWYPNTPSLGCMTSKEMWDAQTGRALMSDQLSLVHAFTAAAANRNPAPPQLGDAVPPQPQGYLVVVELDDARRPVTLGDVLVELLEADRTAAAPQ